MQKKKLQTILILVLCFVSFISMFNTITIKTSAAEKLTPEEETIYNSMTKEEQKEYLTIKELEPKTQLTEEQKNKFDKYVVFTNNKYYIMDSNELEEGEKQIIEEYIRYSNYIIKDVNYSVANLNENKKAIEIQSLVSPRGYGQRFINWYWWGAQIGLSRDDLRATCFAVAGLVTGLMGLMPGIGWSIAAVVAGSMGSLAICYFGINSGMVFQINYAWYGVYVSEYWWQ